MRYLLILLCCSTLLSLTSFSLVPIEKSPPIHHKERRVQKRLKRLQQRFETSSNSRQQTRLQKRIKRLQLQQEDKKVPVFTVLALILTLVGIVPLVLLIIALITKSFLAVPEFMGYIYLLFGGLLLLLMGHGLLFAILALVAYGKRPEMYKGKGWVVVALSIVGAAVLSILITVLVA